MQLGTQRPAAVSGRSLRLVGALASEVVKA